MGALVRLELAGGVATITLDSQPNRNALSLALIAELDECLTAAAARSPRVIVLCHDGPSFCSGADLKERAAMTGPLDSTPMVAVMQRLIESPVPTIAAVDGAVRAGGIGLMASCDIVVVHTSVSFALTEVRIGVAPAIIAVPILRRVVPTAIAPAMLTGEAFDANRALALGLVTHVTDDVRATVAALTSAIVSGSPRAVAATKQLLTRVPTLDRATAFDEMRRLSDSLFQSPDAAEGMAAFREKRSPIWPP
jgi:enoyl-CoA hydratase/carnithine racemase